MGSFIAQYHAVRSRRGILLLAGLLAGLAPMAHAQSIVKDPSKNYTNKSVFHLPIKLEDRHRQALKELNLYVKTPEGEWVLVETIPPTGTFFTYNVPKDGEYWFSVVMVDLEGNRIPPDVTKLPPGKKVVVDAQPPLIEVSPWTSPQGEPFLKCKVHDATADLDTLRLVSENEGVEKTMAPSTLHLGCFPVRGLDIAGSIHVVCKDFCGNEAKVKVDVRDMLTNAVAKASPSMPAVPVLDRENVGKILPPAASQAPVALPGAQGGLPSLNNPSAGVASPQGSLPPLPGLSEGQQTPMLPPPGVPDMPPPVATKSAGNQPIVPVNNTAVAQRMNPTNSISEPVAGAPANRRLLNTPQAMLEYRIDQVGPSGVGKVDVYLTRDLGRSWQLLRQDADKRSPVDLNLPGEGLFGVRLAITNGNGIGGTPPQPGQDPSCWIEVDATAPFVQFHPVDSNLASGRLDIRWTAKDKNLGPDPVSLFYRTRPDMGWQPITRNLKNDGAFPWAFPRDAGGQFYLKIEVVDLAGNVARAETPNPILLDLTEPRGFVLGVTSQTSVPLPPTGN